MPRFFVRAADVTGDTAEVRGTEFRHLQRVLRLREGDRLTLFDDTGREHAGVVLSLSPRVAHVRITASHTPARESPLAMTLYQGVAKGRKLDLVVEKATELGVHAIVPVRSARVIGHDTSPAKVERWRRIAKSAAQQSGRVRIPDVAEVHDWDALLGTFGAYDRVFLPWELAEPRPLREVFERALPAASSVLVIIGPEGGFAAGEVERASAAGALPISLGRRILRTETAALVVLSAILYARGEL